jgi:hypothetical protein
VISFTSAAGEFARDNNWGYLGDVFSGFNGVCNSRFQLLLSGCLSARWPDDITDAAERASSQCWNGEIPYRGPRSPYRRSAWRQLPILVPLALNLLLVDDKHASSQPRHYTRRGAGPVRTVDGDAIACKVSCGPRDTYSPIPSVSSVHLDHYAGLIHHFVIPPSLSTEKCQLRSSRFAYEYNPADWTIPENGHSAGKTSRG